MAFDTPKRGDSEVELHSMIRRARPARITTDERGSTRTPVPLNLTRSAALTVVGEVRLLIEIRIADWGLNNARHADAVFDLLSVAGELVTNAVEATPDRTIHIRCFPLIEKNMIWFGVWDSSDLMPVATMPELSLETLDLNPQNYDTNGGWGLPLAYALSYEYGISPTDSGKWIWASIKLGT